MCHHAGFMIEWELNLALCLWASTLSTEFRAQLPEWMKVQGGKEGVGAGTLKHGTRTISAQLSCV